MRSVDPREDHIDRRHNRLACLPPRSLRFRLPKQVLSKFALLEFDDPLHPWLQWTDWLGAMGWADIKPNGVLRFNQYDQVIQAALAGHGIALGRLELIQPLIDDGRLVRLAPPQREAQATRA
jgi:LysR family transcriptional regulator, glycine cleavage system transcriptional activator